MGLSIALAILLLNALEVLVLNAVVLGGVHSLSTSSGFVEYEYETQCFLRVSVMRNRASNFKTHAAAFRADGQRCGDRLVLGCGSHKWPPKIESEL